MNLIEKIIEPVLLLLVWQAPVSSGSDGMRRVVGRLVKESTGITFEYVQGKELEELKKLGFEGYGFWRDFEKKYETDVMSFFSRRLPPRSRKDYHRFLESMRIPENLEISEFALLGYSGGVRPGDPFSFVHPFEGVEGNCQLLQEVAGFRYYMQDKGAIFMGMAIEDAVELIPEPDNKYDSGAVKIMFNDRKIGYINRFLAPAVLRWIERGNISARIEKVTGTVDVPRVYIFIDVQ